MTCGSLGLRLFAGRLWIRRISVASSLSFWCGTTFIVWMLCLFLMWLFHPTLSFLVYCIGRSLLRDISPYHWRITLWRRVCGPRWSSFVHLVDHAFPICVLVLHWLVTLVTHSRPLGLVCLWSWLTRRRFLMLSPSFWTVSSGTLICHLPAPTQDSVHHALLSTPSAVSLFPRSSFCDSWGMFVTLSRLQLLRTCHPLLPLRLNDFVAFLVLNSLLPLLQTPFYISLVVHGFTHCGFWSQVPLL